MNLVVITGAAVNETRRRAESLISNVTARTAPLQKKVGTGFAIIKKTGSIQVFSDDFVSMILFG